jgi:hypothetical protein
MMGLRRDLVRSELKRRENVKEKAKDDESADQCVHLSIASSTSRTFLNPPSLIAAAVASTSYISGMLDSEVGARAAADMVRSIASLPSFAMR